MGVEHYWANDLPEHKVNLLIRRKEGHTLQYDYIRDAPKAQAIVEREKITLDYMPGYKVEDLVRMKSHEVPGYWVASVPQKHVMYGTFATGKTAHEAQMRMYLLIKYGATIPEDLS